jgi:glycosyltransferase involved in cell wall biosynthesis
MTDVYVYDPTATDALSKVRGVGRYVQILQENFGDSFTFTSNLEDVPDHATFVNPFFDFLKPPLKLKKVSRRQIAVIHDIIPLKYPKHYPVGIKGGVYKRLNRLALRRYSLVITDSLASKNDLIKKLKLSEKKVQVVYPLISNHFTVHKLTKPTSFTVPEKYFLYVADATWNKNLVNLAKAIKLSSVPCIFVGKVFKKYLEVDPAEMGHPELQELRHFLRIAKDDPKFIFPGFVSDEELSYLYKNAIANILVSRDEGFGYSYFEAAALKTPSILGDKPIFHETAEDAALFAKTERPKEIAKQLKTMASKKELRNELGQKAYKRLSLFSAKQFKSQFKDALENSKYYEM